MSKILKIMIPLYHRGAISYTIFMWCNKKEDGIFDKDTKIDWIRYK